MRTKTNVARHRRKKRIRKAARGSWGGRSKLLRAARENIMRSMRFAYIGRKERKRDFRRLWIERINAAARERGMRYSEFMGGLAKAQVALDRRSLAELAVADPGAFDQLVEVAKQS
ncbi:MAG: 50S ribosomal protein L20 [Planctomycetota bacterium]|jgi:large subunit ribosomal protein L20